jgi:hypothetical protein
MCHVVRWGRRVAVCRTALSGKQMKNEIKTTESDEAKKPTKLMKVMFTPEEQACIKLVANLKNIPANEYMRKIVVAQAKKDMKTTNDKINKMADSI